jgi:GxxExxY protein
MTDSIASVNDSHPHSDLTHEIIGACFRVHNTLGYGFLESVYRRALAVELRFGGVAAAQEVPFELTYRGAPIGSYRADLVVESSVIVEVKTGLLLDPIAVPRTLNYLRASQLSIGLVTHFGPRVEIRRVVSTEKGHSIVEWRGVTL